MWIVELLVVLFFIWFGARLGSIGIGYAGGFGVLVLSVVFGLKPGDIPFDVILIIMGVIAAIAAMQEAGGLDYLVQVAARVLKKNPKYITFLARYCRGCQKGRDTSVKAACHWNGCVADCHHRFPHIRGGYLLCIRPGTIRGRLCQTPAHRHSQYLYCVHAGRSRH
jgi:hypothetical protein